MLILIFDITLQILVWKFPVNEGRFVTQYCLYWYIFLHQRLEFARLLLIDIIYSSLPDGLIWSSWKRNIMGLALNIFNWTFSWLWPLVTGKERIKHWLGLFHNNWPKWNFHVYDLSIEHLGMWFWWMNQRNSSVLTFTWNVYSLVAQIWKMWIVEPKSERSMYCFHIFPSTSESVFSW